MILNITDESIIGLIAIIIMLVSQTLVILTYWKYRNLFMQVYLFAWTFFTLYFVFTGLSYLLLIELLFHISYFLNIIAFILIIILFDLMRHDSINGTKLGLYSILIGYYISHLLTEDIISYYYFPNGDVSFVTVGPIRILIPIVAIYPAVVFLKNTYNIYKSCSEKNKYYTLINLIGAIFFTIGPIVVYIFRLYTFIPGIDLLLPAIGLLLVSVSVYIAPNQLYVLSFDLYHLSVIQKDTGLLVYHHSWNKDHHMTKGIQQMYSSMLEALSGFGSSTLNAGKICNIILEKGELMLAYNDETNINFYFSLFSNKRTSLLVDSLKKFEYRFIEEFGTLLSEQVDYISTPIQNQSERIVFDIFNYVV